MIKEKIGDILLRKKSSNLKRSIRVHNLASAKTALVLYNATQNEDEKQIREVCGFLESHGIETFSLGFYAKKELGEMPAASKNHFYFTKKELNFLKVPQSSEVKKFLDMNFDLLIDCNLSRVYSLKYISILSKASFKVGPSGSYHQNFCDLLIALKEPYGLKEYLEQTIHYLKIINTK